MIPQKETKSKLQRMSFLWTINGSIVLGYHISENALYLEAGIKGFIDKGGPLLSLRLFSQEMSTFQTADNNDTLS